MASRGKSKPDTGFLASRVALSVGAMRDTGLGPCPSCGRDIGSCGFRRMHQSVLGHRTLLYDKDGAMVSPAYCFACQRDWLQGKTK